MEEFSEKFRLADLTIKSTAFWTVSIRPKQITLGSLILSLNRNCATFGDLKEEETAELADVFSLIEVLFKNTFQPDKINYIALMMVDDQVHYHVIPRYEKSVAFNTLNYADQDWPKPPDFAIDLNMSEQDLLLLVNTFK